jgi:hypothetical protein
VLRFHHDYRFSVAKLLGSLVSVVWGAGWTTGTATVWVTTPDGMEFMLKKFDRREEAESTVNAYEAQVAASDPVTWAASKGFSQLADHLRDLDPTGFPTSTD